MIMKVLNFCILTAVVTCSVYIPSTIADVTLEQKVNVSASGAMSMMGSTGTVTTIISGDRARTENHMESTSSMMKKFAKNMNTATIVRLDEQLMLNLATEKQQYSEISFEELRAQMEKSMAQVEEMSAQPSLPVSEDECEWSEPVLDVRKTGEKQKFANIKAQQTIITATQTCTVPESGKSCNMTWNMEYWNAKRMPGQKEATAFQEGMAKAMGGDEALGMAQVYSRGLLAMFKEGWDELLQETGNVEGYPVKTVMSLAMGGENCTTTAGQPIALDDVWGRAADAGIDAAGYSAAGHAGNVFANETAGAVGHGVGGSIAGSAVGAASRELMSGAFNKFRKKKKQPEPVVQEANPAAASVVLFKISTELTAVNKNDVADNLFVAPAGWKKVSNGSF
jgi:hypothetical protein